MPTELTIIILTYNSAHIIKSCLEQLNFNKYKVVIVDNASKDNMIEIVEQNFPQVKIIKLSKNIGYGNGNNVALCETNTDFALILNPDSVIDQENIELILAELKKYPQVAIAGPLIFEKPPLNQEKLQEKLEEIKLDIENNKDNFFETLGKNYTTNFVIGCSLFMRMSIFQEIGFFDKDIFLYYEDNELCYRAIQKGYKNIIVPSAYAFHLGGKSSNSKKRLQDIYRLNWHLKGWSKAYWKEIRKGKARAIKSSIRIIMISFIKSIIYILLLNFKQASSYFGACIGTFSYLIGLKAFKKDGNSRG
jgi:N-acetylglucosaminyl-diphospho-decaprenol L-rhamnosyltransferase